MLRIDCVPSAQRSCPMGKRIDFLDLLLYNKFEVIVVTKKEFYSNWFVNFASDIPKKDIDKYVVSTGNYIWHIFSWGLLDESSFLVGDEARKAYNKIDKSDAYYIEWFKDDCSKKLPQNFYTAEALDDLIEVYVTGKNFKWAYIKTHENDLCGPYFIKKKESF